MQKLKNRPEEEKQALKELIITKQPSYEELKNLLFLERNKVRALELEIETYQKEIRRFRKGKRRLRIFLGVFWDAIVDDAPDNKQYTIDELRRWRNNLCRLAQEN